MGIVVGITGSRPADQLVAETKDVQGIIAHGSNYRDCRPLCRIDIDFLQIRAALKQVPHGRGFACIEGRKVQHLQCTAIVEYIADRRHVRGVKAGHIHALELPAL